MHTDCVIAIATVNQLGGLGLEFMPQKTDRGNLDQGPMALSWIGFTQNRGSGWQRFAAEVVAEREATNVPCMVKDFRRAVRCFSDGHLNLHEADLCQ